MIRHWIVYCYIFPNGKRYVGCTRQKLRDRQRRDGNNVWSGYKGQPLIWNALREFGEDNVKIEILYEGDCDDEYANALERKYIEMFKTDVNKYNNPSFGYNSAPGGGNKGDSKLTEETKRRFSERLIQQNIARRGRAVTQRTREHQRNAKLGVKRKPFTDETRRKMCVAARTRGNTDSFKKAQSKIHSKQVIARNVHTGECLFFYNHQKVADYFGVSDSTVSRWVLGQTEPKNGFVFENYTPTTTESSEAV